jgi:hypothetical protein
MTDTGTAAASATMPATQPRYTRTPGDDLQRPTINPGRTDDLDVPTFIRKKAVGKDQTRLASDEHRSDDLDIPTFIRKNTDQP